MNHSKPRGPGPCPSYYFARCREIARGGDRSYREAGDLLVRAIEGEMPYQVDEGRWPDLLSDLKAAILADDGAAVIAWFELYVPRCMTLIPRNRRMTFLNGVYEAVTEAQPSWDGRWFAWE